MIKQTKQRGFTIVELLIVVVIIAILAAITIVAYNGITNRAKTSATVATAASVQKKAEAYAIDISTGLYPTTLAALTGAASSTSYYMPASGVTLVNPVISAAPGDNKSISFYTCAGATGYQIKYWDFTAGAIATIVGGVQTTCTITAT